MTKQSTIKLQEAGYVFVRVDERERDGKKKYIIKESSDHGVWKFLEVFETKAACERRLKELEEDPFVILSL